MAPSESKPTVIAASHYAANEEVLRKDPIIIAMAKDIVHGVQVADVLDLNQNGALPW